jgi:glucokinase
VVEADGSILTRIESPTEPQRGAALVLASLRNTISALAGDAGGIGAIGVACAGQIHPDTQAVVAAPNLCFRDIPLRTVLSEAFGRPVWVENDVRGAAWGEYRFGEGAGACSLVAVFVGTGVGSGAVLGGALWRGAGNAAGEVGHTQVVPEGLPCPCGQRGCMEQYASGSGLQRRFARDLSSGVETRLIELARREPARLTARMVADAATAGDLYAGALWRDLERYLALALANYVTVLNPEVLLLGGGVVETVPTLFDAVAHGVIALTTEMARATVRIERAALGDWGGVVGAADLARAHAQGAG